MNVIWELAEVKVKPRWLHVLQTMGFPFRHVRDWEERKTWKRLHDWPRDHFCWKMSQPKEAQVTCTAPFFSHFNKNGFSVVSQQIFFRRKVIHLKINRKKRHPDPGLGPRPDPESAFYWDPQRCHERQESVIGEAEDFSFVRLENKQTKKQTRQRQCSRADSASPASQLYRTQIAKGKKVSRVYLPSKELEICGSHPGSAGFIVSLHQQERNTFVRIQTFTVKILSAFRSLFRNDFH